MKRSTDRLLALAMLVVGFACFAKLYLALGGKPPAATSAEIFGAAGVLSILAGLLMFAGLLPAAAEYDPSAPLFGREAEIAPAGRPTLRRIALAVPLLALLAVVTDQLGPWRSPVEPAAPVESKKVAAAPALLATPPRELAPAPAPEPAATPALLATPPPELAPAPAPVSAPAEPSPPTPVQRSTQPAAPTQPPSAPVQQTALALVMPPETVAPPPPPPPVQPTAPEGHRDAVVWLAVSADGHEIMSAGTDRMIKLWDIDGKRLIRDLGQHKDMARAALFMPDGKTALTAGDDGEIVLRQLSDGAVLHVFSAGQNGGVNKLAIRPDGKRAVSGHDTGSIIVWDLEKGPCCMCCPAMTGLSARSRSRRTARKRSPPASTAS
ncbi:WD40 repeat domain-containing protein [Mesorhizobium tamadayense]|uniref:WD40 repeat domain-containing protein n=1 Tax=Mesorhizobium tamadayense TaxID=425306 RepID=UPI001FDEE633|nr:hypothetical protein [Mesorhizobium tamadayense]